MSFFVRKIERAKWVRRKSDAVDDTPADAITSCLRTSSNTLSVWRIDSEEQLPNAIVAIVSAGDSIETMDFVIFSGQELNALGLAVSGSPGGTSVKDMVDAHFDIVDLTYATLGKVAGIVLGIVREERVARRTKSQLHALIMDAVESKRITREDLKERLREKLFPAR